MVIRFSAPRHPAIVFIRPLLMIIFIFTNFNQFIFGPTNSPNPRDSAFKILEAGTSKHLTFLLETMDRLSKEMATDFLLIHFSQQLQFSRLSSLVSVSPLNQINMEQTSCSYSNVTKLVLN